VYYSPPDEDIRDILLRLIQSVEQIITEIKETCLQPAPVTCDTCIAVSVVLCTLAFTLYDLEMF